MAKSAFDQMSELTRKCVAGLIGADDCPAFRNNLRDIPPLASDDFKLGEMAIHYLEFRIKYLKDNF